MQDQSIGRVDQSAEQWRAVPGHERWYEVSNQGRVRSLGRYWRNKWGAVTEKSYPVPLVLRTRAATRTRYIVVDLDGRPSSVHRLVLAAFVGPCPDGHEASHLNGIRSDNRVTNLRWEPHGENVDRQRAHGTRVTSDRNPARLHPERMPRGDRNGARLHPERLARGDQNGARLHRQSLARGEANGNTKLTGDAVVAIRVARLGGESQRAIAARHGVSRTVVGQIVRGQTWRHLMPGP